MWSCFARSRRPTGQENGLTGMARCRFSIRPTRDKLWGLLNSITLPGSMGSTLETILRGETAKYFAGDCTVEQTAQRIQTRASLYLSER